MGDQTDDPKHANDPLSMEGMLVLVVWEDAYGAAPDWEGLDEIREIQPPVNQSVGWIMLETDEALLIVPHATSMTPTGRYGCGDMLIPRNAVKRIVHLGGHGEKVKEPVNR